MSFDVGVKLIELKNRKFAVKEFNLSSGKVSVNKIFDTLREAILFIEKRQLENHYLYEAFMPSLKK